MVFGDHPIFNCAKNKWGVGVIKNRLPPNINYFRFLLSKWDFFFQKHPTMSTKKIKNIWPKKIILAIKSLKTHNLRKIIRGLYVHIFLVAIYCHF